MGSVSFPMVLGPGGVPATMIATATMNILGKSLQKTQSGAEDDDLSGDADLKSTYTGLLSPTPHLMHAASIT